MENAGTQFIRKQIDQATRQSGLMSAKDVRFALGSTRRRVQYWFEHKWLRGRIAVVAGTPMYVCNPHDLIRFLNARGGLLNGLDPQPEWRQHVLEARKALLRSTIEHHAIARLLAVSPGYLSTLRKKTRFPQHIVWRGWQNKTYYQRTLILKWLECHAERYDPRGDVRRYLLVGEDYL